MSNFDRGDRALQALAAADYRDPAETVGMKLPTPDGGEAPGPEGYPISDLIADLAHLAQRNGFDFQKLIDEAWSHYGADVVEQAWENSDDWHDTLQDESNQARACAVLRTAGVPMQFDHEVMVKVGIVRP
jgi:hypothetical protein